MIESGTKFTYLAGLFLLCTGLQTGCSWQNTAYAIASSPGLLRLEADTGIEGAPRFTLPAGAGLSIYDDHTTPAAWLEAAGNGIAEVFDRQSLNQGYQLRVSWPSQQAPQQASQSKSTTIALLGVTHLPKPPEVARLPVKLVDNHGNTLAHMTLHISPALWGPNWQDQAHLQNSFRALAETLRDG